MAGGGLTREPWIGAIEPERQIFELKANVAVQHAMLIAIRHMGTTGTLYDDPGADYYTRLHPDRAKRRGVHQHEAMGYRVTVDASRDRNTPARRPTFYQPPARRTQGCAAPRPHAPRPDHRSSRINTSAGPRRHGSADLARRSAA